MIYYNIVDIKDKNNQGGWNKDDKTPHNSPILATANCWLHSD